MRVRRRTVLTAGVLGSAFALAGCTGSPTSTPGVRSGGSTGPAADPTVAALTLATEYLRDWSAGQDAGAAALTSDPVRAVKLLSGTRSNIGLTALSATAGKPTANGDGSVDVPAAVVAQLSGLGPARWQIVLHVVDAARATAAAAAATTSAATSSGPPATATPAAGTSTAAAPAASGGPVVQFRRTLVHPDVTDDTRLAVLRTAAARASILDRAGRALTTTQTLSTVGVEPARLTAPDAAYRLIGSLPNHPDVAALKTAVAAAKPDAFVPVSRTVLRDSQIAPFRARLAAQPGIVVRHASTTLTPDEGFARSVLGRMVLAADTAETLHATLGPLVADTDYVGVGGLQQSAQTQLAGTPGGQFVLAPLTGGDPVKVLATFAGRPGVALRTTLDLPTQLAAQAALAREPRAGALVAVQASTGQLLAVADQGTGKDRADGVNRALNGRYPPGSTFKVVDSAALVAGGLALDAKVPCTATVTVNGQSFKNAEGEHLGDLPFRTDFANSCNTAFISLRDRVPAATLTATAKQFGVGLDWTLGATSYGGSVPAPASENEHAAAMIGQGKVLASPLNMAVVAATVAAGGFHTPVLVTGTGQPPVAAAPPPVPAAVFPALRTLMAGTVANGTATVLRGVADGAKTGTAEYGATPGPSGQLPTHSWMIAYRGDLAVAVLVENGSSGAKTAGPIVRDFLQAVT